MDGGGSDAGGGGASAAAAAVAAGPPDGAPTQGRSALKVRVRVPAAPAPLGGGKEADDGGGAGGGDAGGGAGAGGIVAAPPPPAFSRGAPPPGLSDEQHAELYFLMARFLGEGPCLRAAQVLREEAARYGLLPERYDIFGGRHAVPFGELVERYSHAPAARLATVALDSANSNQPAPGVPGALCGDVNRGRPAPAWHASLHWPLRPLASCAMALRARERGDACRGARALGRTAFPTALGVRALAPVRAGLGHRNAVYCCTFDKTGDRIITGSDDRIVKIWDTHSAYLLHSCKGHDGDVTMLDVNATNEYVASSANDGGIRVWSLASGRCVAVLLGHLGPVTSLAFVVEEAIRSAPPMCAPAEYVLASSSDDGSCKLWDCRKYARDSLRTLKPARPAAAPASATNEVYITVFNMTARFMAAAYEDCTVKVWDIRRDSEKLLFTLRGHKNDVTLVEWANNTDSMLTVSKDGTARVWRPRLAAGDVIATGWECAGVLAVEAPAPNALGEDGGERRRDRRREGPRPTYLAIQTGAWTVDDRHIFLAYSDHSLRVWCASTGNLQHTLKAHAKDVFVVNPHPYDPRLILSAGYDGQVIIWDILTGSALAKGRGAYCDEVYDGRWSNDGTYVLISDNVGYWETLDVGCAPGGGPQAWGHTSAPVEQFLQRDFDPIRRSSDGRAFHEASGMEPDNEPTAELLCDHSFDPYPDPVQSTFQSRRLLGAPELTPQQRIAVARGTGGTRGSVAEELAAAVNPAEAVWGANAGAGIVRGGNGAGMAPAQGAAAPVERAAGTAAVAGGPTTGPRMMTLADIEDRDSDDDEENDPDVAAEHLGHSEEDDDDYDQLIDQDDDDDDDYDAPSRARRRGRGRRLGGRSRSGGGSSRAGGAGSSRSRSGRRRRVESDDEDAEAGDEGEEGVPARASKRRRRARSMYYEVSEGETEDEYVPETTAQAQGPSPGRRLTNFRGARTFDHFGWLRRDDCPDGPLYIPQLGDEVVYLWQGHQQVLENTQDVAAERSALWNTLRGAERRQLQPVERCEVFGMEYGVDDITGKAVAQLKLRITTAGSPLAGSEFDVALQPSEDPDFIVHAKLYDVTVLRGRWLPGQPCHVWWGREGQTSKGDLYSGIVLKVEPIDPGYSTSPWQAIHVQYDGDPPEAAMRHSFWELRDPGPDALGLHEAFTYPDVSARAPELLQAMETAVNTCHGAVYFDTADQWVELPGYADIVAVPMESQLIRSRVQNGYYRTLAAFAHDCWSVARNAAAYNSVQAIVDYATTFARRMIHPVLEEAVAAGLAVGAPPRP